MLPYEIPADFRNAIQKSLATGEQIRVITACFFMAKQTHFNQDVGWVDRWSVSGQNVVMLTNVAVRLFGFKEVQQLWPEQEAKKQILLAKGMSEEKATKKAIGRNGTLMRMPIPEIASTTGYQIVDISAIRYEERARVLGFSDSFWRTVHNYFGPQIVEVSVLTFSCRGVEFEMYSIYNNLADVYRHLDAAKSGAAIASTITSVESALTRLKALLDEGVLTQEEFDQSKDAFVGKAGDVPESAATSMRNLHSLFLSGVLTEPEYRAKKFEVLSRS